MKLICVGTGSDGNTYLLQSDTSTLIIDAGCSWRKIERAVDYDVSTLDVLLVSHFHEDHSKYLMDYFSRGVDCHIALLPQKAVTLRGGWKVIPFQVPHTNNDGTECPNYAYIIEKDGEKLLYMTDWMYCPYNLSKFNINHFLIAVNYTDLEEEADGNIRHVLRGHSSLETAKDFLRTSMTDACKTIIACHLSQRNADEDQILTELKELAPYVKVEIAKKGMAYDL